MQYFVGNLVEGEVAQYYEHITTELAEKFGIKNLAEYIPPHFTFKAPFLTENIEEFEPQVEALAQTLPVTEINVDGFGTLDGKRMTIFLHADGETSLQSIYTVIDALDAYGEDRKQIPRPFVFHMSIARFLSPEQCNEILAYLQSLPKPEFSLKFDNLGIFKFVDEKYVLHKLYRFK